jgi:hypothetical protein
MNFSVSILNLRLRVSKRRLKETYLLGWLVGWSVSWLVGWLVNTPTLQSQKLSNRAIFVQPNQMSARSKIHKLTLLPWKLRSVGSFCCDIWQGDAFEIFHSFQMEVTGVQSRRLLSTSCLLKCFQESYALWPTHKTERYIIDLDVTAFSWKIRTYENKAIKQNCDNKNNPTYSVVHLRSGEASIPFERQISLTISFHHSSTRKLLGMWSGLCEMHKHTCGWGVRPL